MHGAWYTVQGVGRELLGAEVQRYRGAEVQRCRGAEVQRCRLQRFRGAGCRGWVERSSARVRDGQDDLEFDALKQTG